ncbi:BatD family protein [Saccharospirillum sp. HFRX-1]|uniref:BatD family protein n=1 Tax=unclassified Saccharospirillum TaxID=2633430 RepID=UPI00371F4760
MVARLLLLIFVLSVALGRVWAAVEVEVDRSRLYQDERLELTIRADPDSARYPLDLTPLSALFDIDQQSQGQRLRRASNGSIQAWREWHLWLRPRHIGTLQVPSFRLGDERSERILIEVLDPANRGDALPADAVRLEVNLAERELYIGQPTQLTIDLWYQVRLQGEYANLSFGDFNVELLDENNVTEYRNGRQLRRYRLIYRLTADHPGQLELPPIRFVGQYQAGPYGERRSVERTHAAIGIAVKPIPAEYPDDAAWLPARQLSLSDNLPGQLQLAAHAHQEWTVTTEVEGLPPTRLPDPLAGLGGDAWRLYRNAPEFDDHQRRDLAALVFTKPGRQRLPAVRLPWWDLQRDQLAYAELPARTVEVTPEASQALQPTPLAESVSPETVLPSRLVWPWISLALAVGWLFTALVLWFRRRRKTLNKAADSAKAPTPAKALRPADLLAESDPLRFRQALLAWLEQEGMEPYQALAQLSGSAAAVWGRINAGLYGRQSIAAPSRAERKVLLAALIKRQRRAQPTEPDPTQLYPD